MVLAMKESKARKIFEKYENVAAFTLGKSKGINDDELEISYSKLPLLPDEDVLNGIVDGTVKPKKIINEAVKALHKPSTDPEVYNICVTMAQLVNILYPEGKKAQNKKAKKRGPNIIVFVLDDDDSDKAAKTKAKFLVKYVAALFAEFGIEVITDTKVVKKVFVGKKKKVVQRVAAFVANNKQVRISDKGHQLKKTLITFYAIELRQSALKGIEADDLSRNSIKTLLKTLVDTYTNDNMRVTAGLSKKEMKKTCKQLKKKNKAAVAAYDEFVDIMAVVNPELKLPKVKNGYKKGDKPKMNVNKFVGFFTKKGKRSGRIAILLMIYAHTAAVLVGAEPGTSEYTKTMTNVVKSIGMDSDFSKAFISAAKGQATKA